MKFAARFVIILCLLTMHTGIMNRALAAKHAPLVKDPYVGAIVIDAATGATLFEDNADAKAYPASVLKLMNLLIILDQIKAGTLSLEDMVKVTAQSAKMGGSQVYMKEGEEFTVDEMLYALMVKSGNDAAVALAIHTAGSTEAFVELMNARAREMGMKNTVFKSVHGLPPAAGQEPDVTTARDIATLAMEVVKRPEALRYTSTVKRMFRNNTFEMLNNNPLLQTFDGCDGLKTGYYSAAGFSIAATALRKGRRVIAVVMGSPSKETRNKKAAELLMKGFTALSTSGSVSTPAQADKN